MKEIEARVDLLKAELTLYNVAAALPLHASTAE
jgi:hypothetical protein